ncbi:MAG: pyruvate kinase [Hyphomicrobiaceae bacterium]
MRRNRRVKIIATLGPATSDAQSIGRLFRAGADVFRLNMSHATHDLVKAEHGAIRALEEETGRPIGILADLQGPKLRVGEIAGERILLPEGKIFRFDRKREPGTTERVFLPHPQIFEAASAGHHLLLDDGKLKMRIVEATKSEITAEVLVGGALASRKGISLPDTLLPIGALTDKDRSDLAFAAELGVDWIALSFVQRAADIAEAKKLVAGRAAVMAKIEKPSAVTGLEEILELADGLMIARGDLGVEMPVEKVPGLQKRITRLARKAGKPVVVATQMLESMITAPVPTRAEVSDVATAVFEGADAVMLSAESAVGQFPAEAVATMDKVAQEVEQDPLYEAIVHAQRTDPDATGPDAIAHAARTIAETLKTAAIICYTATGSTGVRVARERPRQAVIALTPIPATGRRLAIVWGLHCVLTSDAANQTEMVEKACRIAIEESFAKPGDRIIITAGVPLGTPGATNMIRIAYVSDPGQRAT